MLSIVYITCNRCQELKKSILSCEERVTMNHEYVIVDNGSIDDTEEMLLALEFKNIIRYFKQNENLGVSRARNLGYEYANGDICYFIDDDATITTAKNILDLGYSYMKSRNDIFAMGTDCYDTARERNLRGCHRRYVSDDKSDIIRNYVGCSHFIKKGIGLQSLYPDNLFYGAEELYLGLMVYKLNGKVWHYQDLHILHDPSQNTRYSKKENSKNGHINTFVIKSYFLPCFFFTISTIFFLFRVLRFENYSFMKFIDYFKEFRKRRDKKYNNKLTTRQTLYLCSMFPLKSIL